jgi:hypothetical protein
MPGADDLEETWLRARLGEDGYFTGKDAETAACDAQAVPVVTGHPDLDIIDKIIALARAGDHPPPRRHLGRHQPRRQADPPQPRPAGQQRGLASGDSRARLRRDDSLAAP